MALPPKLRRITLEDLVSLDPEVRKGMSKLLTVLNPFLSSVTNSLNKRLSFTDNMDCVIKELRFTTPDTNVPLLLSNNGTSFGTSYFAGKPKAGARRIGNWVKISGLLTHRSTNLTGFTTPIFKVQEGFRPAYQPNIFASSYDYQPAVIDLNDSSGLAYMPYASSTTPSSHIDLDNLSYFTNDPAPSFPAPFPLKIDVSSLSTKPVACQVVRIEDLTNKSFKFSTIPNIAYNVENEDGTRKVKIYRAEGLTDGHEYKMTVVCYT